MVRLTVRVLLASAILFAGGTSVANPLPQTGVFVFSSLCNGEEDAAGFQVVLIRGYSNDMAVFTRTEGPVMAPLTATGVSVKIDDQTGHIHMSFVDPGLYNTAYLLDGEVSAESIDITSNISGPMKLPRVTDLPRRIPNCAGQRISAT